MSHIIWIRTISKKISLARHGPNSLVILLTFVCLIFSMGQVACQPESAEVVVTRVVTETITEAEEEVEVTRIVTEEVVVEVTQEVAQGIVEQVAFGQWGTTSPNNFCTLAETTGIEEIWRNRLLGATLIDLIDSYEVSDDSMVYTFWLSQNVTWHDGQPFTSADIVFTFDLMFSPEFGHYGAIFNNVVSSVEAIDDYTVNFYMDRPVSGSLYTKSDFWNLTRGWIPVPKHILEGVSPAEICSTEWAQSAYIGLGPFTLYEFNPDESVIYHPFQDYHLGPSQLDEVKIIFSDNPDDLLLELQLGLLDMAQIAPHLIEQVEQDPNLDLPPQTSLLATKANLWSSVDPYIKQALVDPPGETSIPYRDSLDVVQSIIGDATLLPKHPEMVVAIEALNEVLDGQQINQARTVSLFDEGTFVHWAPIGPGENTPLYFGDDIEAFWAFVEEMEGLVVGSVVLEREDENDVYQVEPAVAWVMMSSEGVPEIWLVGPDGTSLAVWNADNYKYSSERPDFEFGTTTPVDIPTAAIDLGTSWCRGEAWGIWFTYPCWW